MRKQFQEDKDSRIDTTGLGTRSPQGSTGGIIVINVVAASAEEGGLHLIDPCLDLKSRTARPDPVFTLEDGALWPHC